MTQKKKTCSFKDSVQFYIISTMFVLSFPKLKMETLLVFPMWKRPSSLSVFQGYSFPSVPEYRYWVMLILCIKDLAKRSVNFAQGWVPLTHSCSQFPYHLFMRFLYQHTTLWKFINQILIFCFICEFCASICMAIFRKPENLSMVLLNGSLNYVVSWAQTHCAYK